LYLSATLQLMSGLALLTDLYQLTMACAYWKSGKADQEAAFHLSFRTPPFQSGFTVACGLAQVIEFLQKFRFEKSDLDYLATIRGPTKNLYSMRAF